MKIKTKELTIMSLLIALGIIFSRFLSFSYPPGQTTLKISISFITIMISILFGPIRGAICAVIIDLFGFFLFGQHTGPYFIGFTLNVMIEGLIPGLIYILIRKYNVKINFTYITNALLMLFLAFGIYFTIEKTNLETIFKIIYIIIFIVITLFLSITSIILNKKYKNRGIYSFDKIMIVYLIPKIIVSFILTPLWISILYGSEFLLLLPIRFTTFPIQSYVSIIILYLAINKIKDQIQLKE